MTNSHEFAFDRVRDNLTGRSSVLVSRGHGKNTKTVEYIANHAASALITPNTGKRIDVSGVFSNSNSDTGEIQLDFLTSEIKVWRQYLDKNDHLADTDLHIEGAVDEVLTVTTTQGDKKVFILVKYREID